MPVRVLQHVDECIGHLWRQLIVLVLNSLKVLIVSEGRHQRQEQPAHGGGSKEEGGGGGRERGREGEGEGGKGKSKGGQEEKGGRKTECEDKGRKVEGTAR